MFKSVTRGPLNVIVKLITNYLHCFFEYLHFELGQRSNCLPIFLIRCHSHYNINKSIYILINLFCILWALVFGLSSMPIYLVVQTVSWTQKTVNITCNYVRIFINTIYFCCSSVSM